jgi:hypothetical protein
VEVGPAVHQGGQRPGQRQTSRKPPDWSCGRGAPGGRTELQPAWPWCSSPGHRNKSWLEAGRRWPGVVEILDLRHGRSGNECLHLDKVQLIYEGRKWAVIS